MSFTISCGVGWIDLTRYYLIRLVIQNKVAPCRGVIHVIRCLVKYEVCRLLMEQCPVMEITYLKGSMLIGTVIPLSVHCSIRTQDCAMENIKCAYL